jgi:hypothetical protein
VIDQSDDAFAFHAFCVGPRLLPQRELLTDLLINMDQDPRGKSLLEDLGFSGFEAVTEDEIACLATLADDTSAVTKPLIFVRPPAWPWQTAPLSSPVKIPKAGQISRAAVTMRP